MKPKLTNSKILMALTILLMSAIWSHAQRGTWGVDYSVRFPHDVLTWSNTTPANPFYRYVNQVQSQGGDMIWRNRTNVTGSIAYVPRDERSVRYRIRANCLETGATTTWVYKSTK